MIFSAFLSNHYHELNGQERQLFDQLLECTDPELADWLCHSVKPTDQGMATIVKRILSANIG